MKKLKEIEKFSDFIDVEELDDLPIEELGAMLKEQQEITKSPEEFGIDEEFMEQLDNDAKEVLSSVEAKQEVIAHFQRIKDKIASMKKELRRSK